MEATLATKDAYIELRSGKFIVKAIVFHKHVIFQYEKTVGDVYVEGSVEVLLDLLQIYREKGAIFYRTCTLLGILGIDSERRAVSDLLRGEGGGYSTGLVRCWAYWASTQTGGQ